MTQATNKFDDNKYYSIAEICTKLDIPRGSFWRRSRNVNLVSVKKSEGCTRKFLFSGRDINAVAEKIKMTVREVKIKNKDSVVSGSGLSAKNIFVVFQPRGGNPLAAFNEERDANLFADGVRATGLNVTVNTISYTD